MASIQPLCDAPTVISSARCSTLKVDSNNDYDISIVLMICSSFTSSHLPISASVKLFEVCQKIWKVNRLPVNVGRSQYQVSVAEFDLKFRLWNKSLTICIRFWLSKCEGVEMRSLNEELRVLTSVENHQDLNLDLSASHNRFCNRRRGLSFTGLGLCRKITPNQGSPGFPVTLSNLLNQH